MPNDAVRPLTAERRVALAMQHQEHPAGFNAGKCWHCGEFCPCDMASLLATITALERELAKARQRLDVYGATVNDLGAYHAAALRRAERAEAALRPLVAAATAYDEAIQQAAALGRSWVESDKLDGLYQRWLSATTDAQHVLDAAAKEGGPQGYRAARGCVPRPEGAPLAEEKRTIVALNRLAKRWPKTLWLFAGNGPLRVIRLGQDGERVSDGEGYDQRYVVADIDIPNDGGDW